MAEVKKSFLICPVRGADSSISEKFMNMLEKEGYEVHWPPRDTDQDDDSGLRICQDNLEAIKKADVVHFIWDGESQGSLFDLGMAFALDKKVTPLRIPEKTPHKSFQNMVLDYANCNVLT